MSSSIETLVIVDFVVPKNRICWSTSRPKFFEKLSLELDNLWQATKNDGRRIYSLCVYRSMFRVVPKFWVILKSGQIRVGN